MLVKNDTWMIVRKPVNKRLVDLKWIFRIKENPYGVKYKARLVARRFNQAKGKNYEETFSPVLRLN